MSATNPHRMKLGQTYPSGAQEWICPQCGRWIVMHHLPEHGKLKTIVLQAGDEDAAHAGGTGSIAVATVRTVEPDEATREPFPPRGSLH